MAPRKAAAKPAPVKARAKPAKAIEAAPVVAPVAAAPAKRGRPRKDAAPAVPPVVEEAAPIDHLGALITTPEAEALLGVSRVWIMKLSKAGYIAQHSRGRWILSEVVQGYIRFLRDEDRRTSKSSSASRMQDVKTQRLEMQMAADRRELVPREEAQIVLDTAAASMRGPVMAVAAKFTREVAERRRLERLLGDALGTIADTLDKRAQALATGRGIEEDDKK
jgi:hypothetical protein